MKKNIHYIVILILAFMMTVLGIDKIQALPDLESNFNIIIKPSSESHLQDGMISYIDMGINSGPIAWGTTKFVMSIDGGETWRYAYCLNNDLYTPYGILNREISDFSRTYNYDNITKILYYGFGGDGWNGTDYDYVRRHSYYIWMPYYNEDNEVVYWWENWTDDLAYVLTHLALSYSYYYDVLGLSEEEADERAFYGVFESEEFTGTKAKSVAKLWYEYLIQKPIVGINVYSDKYESITPMNSGIDNPLSVNFHENISVEGNPITSDIGGRLELIVPKGMNCEVIGESDGATKPGVYGEGTKIILGSDQSFNLSLVKVVNKIENLEMQLYENYNVAKIDGGVDEEGKQLQNIGGIYDATNQMQVLGVSLSGNVGKLNIKKKTLIGKKEYKNSNTYYFGIFNLDDTLYDIVKITMDDEAEKSETFYLPFDGEELKYYIKETDEKGIPLDYNGNVKITVDKSDITINNDNLETTINVVNNYSEVVSPETGNSKILTTLLIMFASFALFAILNLKFYNNISRYD